MLENAYWAEYKSALPSILYVTYLIDNKFLALFPLILFTVPTFILDSMDIFLLFFICPCKMYIILIYMYFHTYSWCHEHKNSIASKNSSFYLEYIFYFLSIHSPMMGFQSIPKHLLMISSVAVNILVRKTIPKCPRPYIIPLTWVWLEPISIMGFQFIWLCYITRQKWDLFAYTYVIVT
jgi:hypothetical protein